MISLTNLHGVLTTKAQQLQEQERDRQSVRRKLECNELSFSQEQIAHYLYILCGDIILLRFFEREKKKILRCIHIL